MIAHKPRRNSVCMCLSYILFARSSALHLSVFGGGKKSQISHGVFVYYNYSKC